MELRMAQEKDYMQIAEMKWLHCEEDDADYNTSNLVGADKEKFLAEFMQFGSDIDDATKATLEAGKRLTEALKQGRYSPIADELQTVLIYAVSEGYAKNVEVKDMERFEKELYLFFETEKASLTQRVKNTRKLDDELRQELKDALAEFVERF